MPGNPLVRFDEGRGGRADWCRSLSYSTGIRESGPIDLSRETGTAIEPLLHQHVTDEIAASANTRKR